VGTAALIWQQFPGSGIFGAGSHRGWLQGLLPLNENLYNSSETMIIACNETQIRGQTRCLWTQSAVYK